MSRLLNGEYLDYLNKVLSMHAQKSLECFVDKLVKDNDPDDVLLTPKEYADLEETKKDNEVISNNVMVKRFCNATV
jgi:hypothetical protein